MIMPLLFLTTILAYMIPMHEQADVKQDVQAMIRASGATIAVAAEHVQTGERILIDERRMFHAASTMKTPVMIEVFKQAREGLFALNDSLLLQNSFKSIVDSSVYAMDIGEDSDDLVYQKVGQKMSIRDLVYQMITVSSNFSTNILIDLVNAKKVTQTMRELGAPDIQVLRGVEDLKAYRLGMNNETTAADLMVILKAIATGSAVDSAASSDMVGILLDQKFRNKIPAHLPEGVRVAHKTGSITGVQHDSGIIYTANSDAFVLVLLSEGWKDQTSGPPVLAKISRRIYDHYTKGN